MNDTTSALQLRLEIEARQVMGFPVHAWVSFVVDSPAHSLNHVPRPDLWSMPRSLGVRLETGDPQRPLGRAPVFDPEPTGDRLRGPTTVRCLVDLGPLLPRRLHPGGYRLALGYARAPRQTLWSNSVVVHFDEPTEAQRRTLAALERQREAAGSWSAWTELPAPNLDELRQPVATDDPLRLCHVYRRLQCDPAALEQVDLRMLSPLAGFYDAQGELLRTELLLARGADEGARTIAEATLARHPGMQPWFDDLFGGHRPLEETRDLLGTERQIPG